MADANPMAGLWQLQQLDKRHRQLQQQLSQPTNQAAYNTALATVRPVLAKIKHDEENLSQLQKRIRHAELALATLEAQIKESEGILYGGATTNAKELAAMERKLHLARTDRNKQEEDLLIAMQEVETLQKTVDSERQNAQGLTRQYKKARTLLEEETSQVKQEMEQLVGERQELVSALPTEWLTRYEKLTKVRQDAISRVDETNCGVCRVEVPPGVLSQVQTSSKPIYCESCGRMLYVPY